MNQPHAIARVATRIFNRPLMMQWEKMQVILQALGPRLGIEDTQPIKAGLFDARSDRKPYAVTERGIAIIDICGSLVNRSTGMEAWSGMSSYEQISAEVEDAATDPAISGILLRCDSFGGETSGAFDAANLIASIRGIKPIRAIVDDYALSAGYLLAAACDSVTVTQTAGVGSVGVIAVHVDQSGLDKEMGVKYTPVFAGSMKNDFTPHEPLGDAAHARLQGEVDRLYGMFVASVAKNRGMKAAAVKATEAGVFSGPEAISSGFADETGTFREALTSITEASAKPKQSTFRTAATSAAPAKEATTMEPEIKADVTAEDPTPVASLPMDEEEKKVCKEEGKSAPLQAKEQPIEPKASFEDIADLCEIAGLGLSEARTINAKSLTFVGVKAEILSLKRAAQGVGIRSTVSPPSGDGLSKIKQAAAAINEPGLSEHQKTARALRATPALYSQYLSENPAQAGNR